MDWWANALLIAGGYLLGSAPLIHLLATHRGVDLRRVGSGNVGGSNLWQNLGPGVGAVGALADILKGVIPVVIGRGLGFDLNASAAAGVAAVAGQIWPLFLRFDGGRGNSAGLGMAIVASPVAFALSLVPAALGSAWKGLPALLARRGTATPERWRFRAQSRSVPLGLLGTFALMPLLSWLRDDPPGVTWALLAVLALIVARRLTAGLCDHRPRGLAALWHRLLFDRQLP
ncbi:MAG: hypothetical protein EXR60_04790 [Dehalococcoidia bacterium]|nr:hypothetical protein [Dehalococcoidia bacterium]